jgi:hypothetical protein
MSGPLYARVYVVTCRCGRVALNQHPTLAAPYGGRAR